MTNQYNTERAAHEATQAAAAVITAAMAKVLRKIYACHRNGKTTLPQHALDDLTAVLDRMQP